MLPRLILQNLTSTIATSRYACGPRNFLGASMIDEVSAVSALKVRLSHYESGFLHCDETVSKTTPHAPSPTVRLPQGQGCSRPLEYDYGASCLCPKKTQNVILPFWKHCGGTTETIRKRHRILCFGFSIMVMYSAAIITKATD